MQAGRKTNKKDETDKQTDLQEGTKIEREREGGGGLWILLILYLEDDGFRPWPNLPTGPR